MTCGVARRLFVTSLLHRSCRGGGRAGSPCVFGSSTVALLLFVTVCDTPAALVSIFYLAMGGPPWELEWMSFR